VKRAFASPSSNSNKNLVIFQTTLFTFDRNRALIRSFSVLHLKTFFFFYQRMEHKIYFFQSSRGKNFKH
jgi:hypothetical protein